MESLGKNLKEVLDKNVYDTSFVIMENNPMTNYINDAKMNHQLPPFMRKGDVSLPRLPPDNFSDPQWFSTLQAQESQQQCLLK